MGDLSSAAGAGATSSPFELLAQPLLWVGLLGVVALAALAIWRLRRRVSGAPQESSESSIRVWVERGEFEKAGDLRMQQGNPQAALELYRRCENRAKQARAYLELKQPVEAAELYRQLGRHAEAAHYFQTAGSWADAAECLLILGSVREAAELFERAGNLQRAAELTKSLGDNENASRLFARAGRGSEAANCLIEARGRRPKVLIAAAEHFLQAQDLRRAAECFAEAGDARRAGEIFQRCGEWAEAARNFAREQLWDRAAHAFREAGQLVEARVAYERAGDRVQSAQLALELGHAFDAAGAFYQIGSYERALEALQSVESDGPDGRSARRLRARIFIEKGLHDRAREELDAMAPDGGFRKEDLETLLMLATALERKGDAAGALALLERIQEVDDAFGDVGARVERLQERAWGVSQTLGPIDSGRYELRDEIGRGGMGIVHLAWDLELERPVAIKFLPAELGTNPASVRMFRQEARAAAAMNHPNIVHVYDVALVGNQPCIVMEYVQGRTVREVMRVRGRREKAPLPPRRVAEIAREVCLALGYAHSRNVIHRDIKPGNILISGDGRVKLMDFGISKVLETGAEGLTQAKGTPQYMPPEQILGREIDGRTDLYALGISMFEMATGERPFKGENIVDQQLHSPIPDPATLGAELPRELVAIVLRACEKEPAQRFASAADMAEALARFTEEYEDTIATTQARPPERG